MFWGLPEQLLASVVDALHAANWQRSGNKRAPRPKPILRPGVKDTGPKKLGVGSGMTFAQVVEKQRRWAAGENRRVDRHRMTVGKREE